MDVNNDNDMADTTPIVKEDSKLKFVPHTIVMGYSGGRGPIPLTVKGWVEVFAQVHAMRPCSCTWMAR